MKPSAKLTHLIKKLCVKHDIKWQEERVCLYLQMEESESYLAIENLGNERMSIGLYFECECLIVPEIEIVLWSGYQPELQRANDRASNWAAIERVILYEGSSQYVDYDANGGVTRCFDPLGQSQLSRFADDWSDELLARGWLDRGVATQTAQNTTTEEVPSEKAHRRIPGCQSTNHSECYGELWQCASCGKTVCYAEGTDNLIELCDDCWAKAQPATESTPWTIVRGTRCETTIIGEAPPPSIAMQQLIEKIATKHGVDLNYYLAFLWLEKPDCAKRLIVERIDEWHISVALAAEDETTGRFVADPDMIFLTGASGWIPVEVYCSPAEWSAYLTASAPNDDVLQSRITTNEYAAFVDYWATQIQTAGWLAQGILLPEPAWEIERDEHGSGAFDHRHGRVIAGNTDDEDIPF